MGEGLSGVVHVLGLFILALHSPGDFLGTNLSHRGGVTFLPLG